MGNRWSNAPRAGRAWRPEPRHSATRRLLTEQLRHASTVPEAGDAAEDKVAALTKRTFWSEKADEKQKST